MPDGRFSVPGELRTNLEQAWRDRLIDAEALLQQGRTASAIAQAIYTVEIFLKVLICKKLNLDALPRPFEIHELRDLLLLAGLSKRIDEPALRKLKPIWDDIAEIAKEINDLRYQPSANWNKRLANTTVNRVKNKVVPWLMTL
jgi:hypothetical protein